MRFPSQCLRIEHLLIRRIESGEYPHNSFLPSENDLAAHFGAARNTVRKAIAALVEKGMILKSQGRMSKVNYPASLVSGLPRYLAWFWYLHPSVMTTNTIYFEMFKLMVEFAREEGLGVQIFDLNSPGKWQDDFLHDKSCVGAFSVGVSERTVSIEAINWLKTLPRLIAVNDTGGNPGCCLVSIDNYAGGRIAAEHLLDTGARNMILLHTHAEKDHPFQMRMQGFRDVVTARCGSSCTVKEFAVRENDWNSTISECETILQSNPDVEALFCLTDQLALNMLDAAARAGKKVPDDLLVMGFDGTYAGQHIATPLTSVSQPLEEVVRTALDLALEMDRGNGIITQRNILFPGKLLPGATTGKRR